MRRIAFLISALALTGCALKPAVPVCSEQYRQGLFKSLAYWKAQPEEFHGYRGAVENLNYKISQFNYSCVRSYALRSAENKS